MKYNLENLHWQEFERVVSFYLKKKIGEGLSIFGGDKDQGRDATFSGIANEYPSKSGPYSGEWIFQVKHRTTRNKSLVDVEKELLRSLNFELQKIFLKHSFACDIYIYVTNLDISNSFRPNCEKVFGEFCAKNNVSGVKFGVIEYKDLEVFLATHDALKRQFPSLLTFTDLEHAFLKGEATKNEGYIKFAQENIRLFVSTTHYTSAAELLNDNRLLMIVGDPKSGKTSIVQALAVSLLEEGRFKPHFIRTTAELFKIIGYLPADEEALFICDDIFGRHELDSAKLHDWADYFQSVMGLIDENHRFVFTTRKYIYEQFANRTGMRSLFPKESDPARHVIKVSRLTKGEREQILEKHLTASDLASDTIKTTLSAKEDILACRDFSPEVIRSLVSLLRTCRTPVEVLATISTHLEHPDKYVYDFFSQITPDKRLLLLSVAVSPSSEADYVEKSFLSLLRECNQQPSVIFQTFIDELDGSIIKKIEYLESSEIDYYHPSMFDVIMGICDRDKYYRALILKHVNFDLLWVLTLRGASSQSNKIQVRSDEFDELLQGLDALLTVESTLPSLTSVLRWVEALSVDVPYNIGLLGDVARIKQLVRSRITGSQFYAAHLSEPIQQWINLLDKWQAITGRLNYKEQIELLHRDYSATSYWQLVFLLENINSGFIEAFIDRSALAVFIEKLTKTVRNLRLSLNIRDGKPTTDEEWLPLFYEVESLIARMRKSAKGKRIIEGPLLDDWKRVKLSSDFARNRHLGMVKNGHWKTMPRLRSQTTAISWT